jgi:hypothetical protein
MFSKADIFQKIEELSAQCTNKKGRFDLHVVEENLALFLHSNRRAIDVDRLSADYVTSYDRAKRPKFQGKQLNLFEADAWIPVGSKQRVQMKLATREDMMSWASIEIHEHTTSATAHAKKMTYINSRLSVWDAGCKTLAELESSKFEEAEEEPK